MYNRHLCLWKNDEIIQGQAEISEYRVSSKVPGRILKFNVREGQTVHKGDTLAIIEAPEVTAKMEQAEAVRLAAMAQNKKAEKGARQEQIQAAYELWQKAIVGREILEKSFSRISNLYKEGVVSEQRYDETKAQYEAAKATEKLPRHNMTSPSTEHRKKTKNGSCSSIASRRCCSRSIIIYR